VRYFIEIHELQTELSMFEARGVANFGTRCSYLLACLSVTTCVAGCCRNRVTDSLRPLRIRRVRRALLEAGHLA